MFAIFIDVFCLVLYFCCVLFGKCYVCVIWLCVCVCGVLWLVVLCVLMSGDFDASRDE